MSNIINKTPFAGLQSPSEYRRQIKKQRSKLSHSTRRRCALSASLFLPKLHTFLPKHANIALYLDGFGELPTAPIMQFCQRHAYQAFLPITKAGKPLRFAPITLPLAKTLLVKHPLGMYEPVSPKQLAANQMDLIICPVVAVDGQGVRLGMGGGFYDRTFFHAPNALKVAWCYDFQLIDKLPKQPWDQSVDIIITDQRIVYL